MYSPSKRFVYIMGLIDYLGRWNFQRYGEMFGKTFLAHFTRQDTNFSVKPPHEFAHRFLKKVKRVFEVREWERNMDEDDESDGDGYQMHTQIHETMFKD